MSVESNMDAFKRENFEKLHAGTPFPSVQSLSERECERTREQIAVRLGGSPTDTGSQVVRQIAEESEPVVGVDAQAGDFDLLQLVDGLQLDHSQHALLNWGQFEEVDRVDLRELARFFSDFWYPGSDDLDIIDHSYRWVLSVRHDGVVSVLRFMS